MSRCNSRIRIPNANPESCRNLIPEDPYRYVWLHAYILNHWFCIIDKSIYLSGILTVRFRVWINKNGSMYHWFCVIDFTYHCFYVSTILFANQKQNKCDNRSTPWLLLQQFPKKPHSWVLVKFANKNLTALSSRACKVRYDHELFRVHSRRANKNCHWTFRPYAQYRYPHTICINGLYVHQIITEISFETNKISIPRILLVQRGPYKNSNLVTEPNVTFVNPVKDAVT